MCNGENIHIFKSIACLISLLLEDDHTEALRQTLVAAARNKSYSKVVLAKNSL